LELQVTPQEPITEDQAAELVLAVKTVAHALVARGITNGYQRVYGELYRRHGITVGAQHAAPLPAACPLCRSDGLAPRLAPRAGRRSGGPRRDHPLIAVSAPSPHDPRSLTAEAFQIARDAVRAQGRELLRQVREAEEAAEQ